jgi:hypothetical protein
MTRCGRLRLATRTDPIRIASHDHPAHRFNIRSFVLTSITPYQIGPPIMEDLQALLQAAEQPMSLQDKLRLATVGIANILSHLTCCPEHSTS